MKKFLFLTIALLFILSPSVLFAKGSQSTSGGSSEVEVLHWWTSGSEAAALNILKETLEDKNIQWVDSPIAGGGGTQAMTALRARVTAGNPPAAVQMLGFDILDWGKLGVVADLNTLAEEENWETFIPDALKKFSKYNGKWIAVPVNIHSTNWLWGNKKILDSLNIKKLDTWDDFVAALKKVKSSGKIALAHGGQAWQDATIFDGVVLSTGGPEFYKKALIDLDIQSLGSSAMQKVFDRMAVLRTYVDDSFSGRDWNLASAMLINGEAAFQMMGDWAKGEFINADLMPDKDFIGIRTPGSQGSVTFNSDQFVMFRLGEDKKASQSELAKEIISKNFQEEFSKVKGSVPARMDIAGKKLDSIGQQGIKDVVEANKNGTLLGSMAHGHANAAAVKNAMYDVITKHFNGGYTSSKEAVQELVKSVKAAK